MTPRSTTRRRFETRLPLIAVASFLAAAVAGGCGEAGGGPAASLTVTRDFGATPVVATRETPVTAGLTAMRQLQTHAKVDTAYGGRYVNALDGIASDATGGKDWLYYVDGSQPDIGATSWRVKPGQRLQWDFHNWRDITTPEAVVGAFPRPFTATGAKLVCLPEDSPGCAAAGKRLKAAGIGAKPGWVRVVVGEWPRIADEAGVPQLGRPPADSGAFASITPDHKLQLLGVDGEIAGSYGAGSGLVAAARQGTRVTWVVTGVDAGGVAAAAKLLDHKILNNNFAVAALPTGPAPIPLRRAATQ
ncbi:MAG: DUF4430 domain-containing protein [Solirubrobacterales bacterium]